MDGPAAGALLPQHVTALRIDDYQYLDPKGFVTMRDLYKLALAQQLLPENDLLLLWHHALLLRDLVRQQDSSVRLDYHHLRKGLAIDGAHSARISNDMTGNLSTTLFALLICKCSSRVVPLLAANGSIQDFERLLSEYRAAAPAALNPAHVIAKRARGTGGPVIELGDVRTIEQVGTVADVALMFWNTLQKKNITEIVIPKGAGIFQKFLNDAAALEFREVFNSIATGRSPKTCIIFETVQHLSVNQVRYVMEIDNRASMWGDTARRRYYVPPGASVQFRARVDDEVPLPDSSYAKWDPNSPSEVHWYCGAYAIVRWVLEITYQLLPGVIQGEQGTRAIIRHIGGYQVDMSNDGILGKGAFGVVRRAVDTSTKQTLAVKQVAITNRAYVQQIENECKFALSLNHPNLIKAVCLVADQQQMEASLFMELLERGSLLQFLSVHKSLSEQLVMPFFKQLLSAVSYLHECGIAHLDLKPANVLLTNDEPPVLKISDYGISTWVFTRPTPRVGTEEYMAPEIRNLPAGHALPPNYDARCADMYSLGVILAKDFVTQSPSFVVTQALHDLSASLLDADYTRRISAAAAQSVLLMSSPPAAAAATTLRPFAGPDTSQMSEDTRAVLDAFNQEASQQIDAPDLGRYVSFSVWMQLAPALRAYLTALGCELKPVAGGGSCLFTAVALHLTDGNASLQRQQVFAYLQVRDPSLQANEALASFRDLDSVCKQRQWDEKESIAAIARVFHRPVHILIPPCAGWAVDINGVWQSCLDRLHDEQAILLLYNGYNRYDAIARVH